MTDRYYVPLKSQVAAVWPHDLITIPNLEALDNVWVAPAEVQLQEHLFRVETALLFDDALELRLPGLDFISISLGAPGTIEVPLAVRLYPPFQLMVGPVPVNLNLISDLLVPAENINPDPNSRPQFEPRPGQPLSISLASLTFTWDLNGDIDFTTDISFALPPAMIGETGLVISATAVRPVFSAATAAAAPIVLPPGERGLYVGEAALYFPEGLSNAFPDSITLTEAFIGTGGVSGRVTGTWSPAFDETSKTFSGSGAGDIFGIPFGLQSVSVRIQQNTIVECDIRGELVIPYFEERAAVRVNLMNSGDFTVTVAAPGPEGITLRKEDLLALSLKSITVRKEGDVGAVLISGGLEPLLMASDGLEWPRLDLEDLYLDTTGKFYVREAWLDLKDLATLDLWGFHFELNRVGVGYEEARDRLWLDLTGSLRLIEQLPVGLGVEGFRISWPRVFPDLHDPPTLQDALTIASQIEVKFDGIYLFYGVPQAVEFEGFIRFIKEAQKIGFAGDVVIRVPASGFSLEAGLMVGMNFEAPPYPFLYVYLGVELPKGIPLGQSGLALKGALGLFGLNVVPDKTPEQNWYYDWYKRGPFVGAHQTNKWRDERWAVALGVGVTITTTDGYIKGVRGLLVLAIPGPILILEGRSLIFDGLLPGEPPLRALAVFDGRELTTQFNIEAQAEIIEDMLDAYGMLEAFFDFKDLTNWHLYLGQDEPRDRRIQANILKFMNAFLFRADVYLMLDMIGAHTLRARLGAFIGFKPPIPSFGPVKVTLDAVIEGEGVVTVLPEQFSGRLDLSANVEVSAFGFGIRMVASAEVLNEGPEPFVVDFGLLVEASIPLPLAQVEAILPFSLAPITDLLPPLEFSAELQFHWEAPGLPELVAPLSGAVADSDFAPGGGALRLYQPVELVPPGARRVAAEESPVVPLDARPTLIFEQEMNDESGGDFARDPDGGLLHYNVGPVKFIPALRRVELYEHRKAIPWTGDDSRDWQLIAASEPSPGTVEPLWGVWLADAAPTDPSAPSARRLRLWTAYPFAHTAGGPGMGLIALFGMAGANTPYMTEYLNAYPEYFTCREVLPAETCINFAGAAPATGMQWEHQGLQFESSDPFKPYEENRRACVLTGRLLTIRFPEPVRHVTVRLCAPIAQPHTETRRRPRTSDEFRQVFDEARARRRLPEFFACHYDVASSTKSDSPVFWVIEAQEGFDCLTLTGGPFALEEICYFTDAEIRHAERAKRQCDTLGTVTDQLGEETELLKPGSYYRLRAVTQVEVDPALTGLPPMLRTLYEGVVTELILGGSNPAAFTHEAFFQTEDPPEDLERYVKWASASRRVFREDDLLVRFKRSYVRGLFGDLGIRVREASGQEVQGYATGWLKAGSATATPDERIWLKRLGENPDDPGSRLPHDDVIAARRSATAVLAPRARHELTLIRRADGAVLHSIPFTTSAFRTFRELVETFGGTPEDRYGIGTPDAAPNPATLAAAAHAEYRAQIDRRDGVIDRATYEAARLALREARADYDAAFRALAGTMHVPIFDPPPAQFAVHPLYSGAPGQGGAPVGFWLRSPETLDLRLSGPDGQTAGRTTLKLERRAAPGGAWQSLGWQIDHDADSTELLLYPASGGVPPGEYRLELTYHRNLGDEQAIIDHRYDRPVEQRGASSAAETVHVQWQITGG